MMEYLPWIIAALAVAGVVFFLLHHKATAAASAVSNAAAGVQSEAMSVVSRLTDALHVANKTNQMQAVVIASPPVQAAINAPPAPVIVPDVMPTAAPPVVTPYTGPFFDITGKPDPLGQYDERTWKIAAGQAVDNATTRANGPVDVKSLTDGDKAFLLHAQENYSLPGAELFFAVLNGSKADIDAAISWADNHRGQVKADPTRFAGLVDAYSKGMLKPVYTNA